MTTPAAALFAGVRSRRILASLYAALALAGLAAAGCSTPYDSAAQPSALQQQQAAAQALPSWRDGAAREALLKFVADVTQPGSPNFVPPEERVAVFDNDGTLWSEQPMYFQFFFLLDQVRAAAPQHPEWRNDPAYKALMANDMQALMRNRKQALALIAKANSGMSVEEYDRTIRDWMASARHPRFNKPYTELVFQPQLELLSFLRANGFRTYIVSGGTIDFMRPWSQAVYGIPPEQVIGSSQGIRYAVRDGKPVLMREPKVDFIDDGPGKPVGIYRHIGRRPILAVGNSDGDLQMLEYTTGGTGPRLGVLVHHDDAEREFAYDRQSAVGKLDKALDAARAKGWTVISMKRDWSRIYP
ncbi:haloacid dehalogenase-like hydrolase [Cupriavidus respiraculi]|uniref:HAD family hydrolase n=1 Tax=Cupriavidus respiraculi TaxID=195930 RepID=UPI001C97507B|nr:HAD family hydrolase [Cupriavidus respiraculi]MBY4947988.1 haloacid dehalogenase-like hydrolase [Cupriavidus respiraculi]